MTKATSTTSFDFNYVCSIELKCQWLNGASYVLSQSRRKLVVFLHHDGEVFNEFSTQLLRLFKNISYENVKSNRNSRVDENCSSIGQGLFISIRFMYGNEHDFENKIKASKFLHS